jgi:hypothetical protein
MAIPALLFDKSTAVLSVQILGVGFMLAVAWLSMSIASHLTRALPVEHRRLARILAFLGALSYYPLGFWTLMGMETGLLTVLLLAAVLCALEYGEDQQPPQLLMLALWLGLAFLTRYDSLVFAVPLFAYVVWAARDLRTDRKTLGALLAAGGICLLFVIGQFAFNRLYYGEWLPNTYILKVSGHPLLQRLANGLAYVRGFLAETIVLLIPGVAGLLLRVRRQAVLLVLLSLAALLEQIYVGGDTWSYWRILAPTVPLLTVLLIWGAAEVVERAFGASRGKAAPFDTSSPPASYRATALITCVTLVGLLTASWRFRAELSLQQPPLDVSYNQRNVNTALALSLVTTKDASVGVLWAGSIPYYTGLRAIDFLGKSDSHIANLPPRGGFGPGHDKYDLDYSIKALKPTYVQAWAWAEQSVWSWVDTHYVWGRYESVFLLLRKDAPEVLWDRIRVRTP